MLCDASNDFRQDFLLSMVRPFPGLSSPEAVLPLVSTKKGAASGGEKVFPVTKLCLYSACSSGGKKRLADGGVCIFLTFAQSIHLNQLFCNFHDL